MYRRDERCINLIWPIEFFDCFYSCYPTVLNLLAFIY